MHSKQNLKFCPFKIFWYFCCSIQWMYVPAIFHFGKRRTCVSVAASTTKASARLPDSHVREETKWSDFKGAFTNRGLCAGMSLGLKISRGTSHIPDVCPKMLTFCQHCMIKIDRFESKDDLKVLCPMKSAILKGIYHTVQSVSVVLYLTDSW